MYCRDNNVTPAIHDKNMSSCLLYLEYLPFRKIAHSKPERKNVFCDLTAPVGHARTLNEQVLCFNNIISGKKFQNFAISAPTVRPMRLLCCNLFIVIIVPIAGEIYIQFALLKNVYETPPTYGTAMNKHQNKGKQKTHRV